LRWGYIGDRFGVVEADLLGELVDDGWTYHVGYDGKEHLVYKDRIYATGIIYQDKFYRLPEELKKIVYVEDIDIVVGKDVYNESLRHESEYEWIIESATGVGTSPHLGIISHDEETEVRHLCLGSLESSRADNIIKVPKMFTEIPDYTYLTTVLFINQKITDYDSVSKTHPRYYERIVEFNKYNGKMESYYEHDIF
jgi:hypothetical protein